MLAQSLGWYCSTSGAFFKTNEAWVYSKQPKMYVPKLHLQHLCNTNCSQGGVVLGLSASRLLQWWHFNGSLTAGKEENLLSPNVLCWQLLQIKNFTTLWEQQWVLLHSSDVKFIHFISIRKLWQEAIVQLIKVVCHKYMSCDFQAVRYIWVDKEMHGAAFEDHLKILICLKYDCQGCVWRW